MGARNRTGGPETTQETKQRIGRLRKELEFEKKNGGYNKKKKVQFRRVWSA